jgi:hypothetical protein
MITGLNTFSSKAPWEAANPIAASFPITCAQTMVMASHWVGFTFPGMMLEPGSFSGRFNSPSPHRGPDARKRTSFAILNRSAAAAFNAPLKRTTGPWEARAWNLLGAVTKGFPVN